MGAFRFLAVLVFLLPGVFPEAVRTGQISGFVKDTITAGSCR